MSMKELLADKAPSLTTTVIQDAPACPAAGVNRKRPAGPRAAQGNAGGRHEGRMSGVNVHGRLVGLVCISPMVKAILVVKVLARMV